MRINTTDPMSGTEVTTIGGAPVVVEGTRNGTLKIYIEPEAN